MHDYTEYDVLILGSGPAGLQAAIHAARKKVSVLVLGKAERSSIFHAQVENFCCIFNLQGEEMLEAGRQQASGFGADFLDEDVLEISGGGERFTVTTESGSRFEGKSLVIATGTTRNRLGVPGEKELLGRGVGYCVDCDANFYRGETVAVVGDASAAVSGALTLLEYASEVHLVCAKPDVSEALEKRLRESPVHLHEGVRVTGIEGAAGVERISLDDGTKIAVSGVFIELGAKGLMEIATALGVRLDDEMKYIATDKQMRTSVPGVFAAGDICGPPWQMAKAVGEGCVAGINAADFAKKLEH